VRFRIAIPISGLLMIGLLTFVPPTHAQTSENPSMGQGQSSGDHSQWRAMRQEMIAACADKSAGTACSFSREGQTVSGICHQSRRGKLVCRTGRGGRGGGMQGGNMGGGMPSGNAPEQ